MKMKADHRDLIADGFKDLAKLSPTIRQGYLDRGLSETRFLWDAFRAARIEKDSIVWTCRTLYGYLNDSTIETGLRYAANLAWPKGEA